MWSFQECELFLCVYFSSLGIWKELEVVGVVIDVDKLQADLMTV